MRSFSACRASFPETHPQFAGHLDWRRRGIRDTLSPHDTVLVLGTQAFLVYILEAEEPIDKTYLESGAFEVDIAGRSYPAVASLRPLYDPEMLRIKS